MLYNEHNTKTNKTMITIQTIKKIGSLLFLGKNFIIGYCEKVWQGNNIFLTIFHNITTILILCFWEKF